MKGGFWVSTNIGYFLFNKKLYNLTIMDFKISACCHSLGTLFMSKGWKSVPVM